MCSSISSIINNEPRNANHCILKALFSQDLLIRYLPYLVVKDLSFILCLLHKFLSFNLRGTQLPNLSGNSEMRSSLTLSFRGPRMMTGLVYWICNCCTASYDNTVSSPPARINNMITQNKVTMLV